MLSDLLQICKTLTLLFHYRTKPNFNIDHKSVHERLHAYRDDTDTPLMTQQINNTAVFSPTRISWSCTVRCFCISVHCTHFLTNERSFCANWATFVILEQHSCPSNMDETKSSIPKCANLDKNYFSVTLYYFYLFKILIKFVCHNQKNACNFGAIFHKFLCDLSNFSVRPSAGTKY